MIEATRYFLFVFGVLTIVGGLIGFLKAGSKASLIAGSFFGLALLVAGYLVGGGHQVTGLVTGLILSLALAGRFLPTFLRTKKPMPAGMMAILSILGAILTGLSLAAH